jgi:Domain of unknown function (DUF4389)
VTAFSPYQAYPAGPDPVTSSGPPPILVAVADPAPQRRVTVAFRLILAIPHFIALYVLSIAAFVILIIGWFGALFSGRLPEFADSFIAGYLRWTVRVYAYLLLLTDAYPPFTLDEDAAYPVRLGIPPAQPLNRAAVFFRIILCIPAYIVAMVLIYGAGTLISFIAWLVTLVAGRLPDSFHLAFAAVLRYSTRSSGYFWLLTPAYPRGVYGDRPGATTWADAQPAAGAPAAYGYGAPGQGYQAPGQGYGTPGQGYGYGNPAQGYGYGAPGSAYGNPGYGAPYGSQPVPGGYGPQPVFPQNFQPANWALLLTSGARRLVTLFIVLGAVLSIGYLVLQGVLVGKSSSGALAATTAIPRLEVAYTALDGNVNSWEKASAACGGQLACVTPLDAKAAGYFQDFGSQLAGTSVPASARPDAARLQRATTQLATDFTELSQASTAAQYQSTVASAGLQQTIGDFQGDFTALIQKLESY